MHSTMPCDPNFSISKRLLWVEHSPGKWRPGLWFDRYFQAIKTPHGELGNPPSSTKLVCLIGETGVNAFLELTDGTNNLSLEEYLNTFPHIDVEKEGKAAVELLNKVPECSGIFCHIASLKHYVSVKFGLDSEDEDPLLGGNERHGDGQQSQNGQTGSNQMNVARQEDARDLLNGQRLIWVEYTPQNWWPALRFDSYEEALKHVPGILGTVPNMRSVLSLQDRAIRKVACLLGINEWIPLTGTTMTQAFYEHCDNIVNCKMFAGHESARDMLLELHEQDFKMMDQVPISPPKKLKASAMPGNATTLLSTQRAGSRTSTRTQHQRAYAATPPNQKTQPQDPGIPILSSEDEEEDEYQWNVLWKELKQCGWTSVKAARYSKLHDWYYVRPGCSVQGGELGLDYFENITNVMYFVRSQRAEGASGTAKLTDGELTTCPSRKTDRDSMDMTPDNAEDVSGKEDEDCGDEEDLVRIYRSDPWIEVWTKLKQLGWKKKITCSGKLFWTAPGASCRSGRCGKDYFSSLQKVQGYFREEYGWEGEA